MPLPPWTLITVTCRLLFHLFSLHLLDCLTRRDRPKPLECARLQASLLFLPEERSLARSIRPRFVVLAVPTLRTAIRLVRRVW